MMQTIVNEGFMCPSNIKLVLVASDPEELVNQMTHYTPPVLGNKWQQLKPA